MPQKVTITNGGFQDALGTKLANGLLTARLQQDVGLGVQIAAGRLNNIPLDENGDVLGDITLWGPALYNFIGYDFRGQQVWSKQIEIPDASTFSLTPGGSHPIPVIIQSVSALNENIGTNLTVSVTTGPVSSSNKLIVPVSCLTVSESSGPTFSVTDNHGNTYTQVWIAPGSNASVQGAAFICESPAGGSGGLTLTLLCSGFCRFPTISGVEVSGLASSSFDKSAFVQAGATTTLNSGTTGTTTVTNEVVISLVYAQSFVSVMAITSGAGYTSESTAHSVDDMAQLLIQAKVITSIGAQSATATLNTTTTFNLIACLTFKGA